MGEGVYTALGADLAFMQQDQIIGRADFIGQMRGPKDGKAGCGQIVDVIGDRFARAGVQADGGFIQQQKCGAMDQGAGDFHAPAMAAIERAEFLIDPLRHAQTRQRVQNPRVGGGAGQAMQRREIPHIGAHRGIQIKGLLLKHHANLRQCFLPRAVDAMPADFDNAGRGADQARQHRNQRGFARAIRAKKRGEPAALHRKRDIAQGGFCAPRVAQIYDV